MRLIFGINQTGCRSTPNQGVNGRGARLTFERLLIKLPLPAASKKARQGTDGSFPVNVGPELESYVRKLPEGYLVIGPFRVESRH